MRQKIRFQDILIIFVLAAAFGMMGFLYSFIDFTQPPHQIIALEPFKDLTIQEMRPFSLWSCSCYSCKQKSENWNFGEIDGTHRRCRSSA